MNKIKFLNFLNHPESISKADLPKLEALAEEYPYSQVIHILVAKGRHNLGLETFRSGLHRAALSANNRDLLKKLIEDVKVSNIIPPLETEEASTVEVTPPIHDDVKETTIEPEEVISENPDTGTPEIDKLQSDTPPTEISESTQIADLQNDISELPEVDVSEKLNLEIKEETDSGDHIEEEVRADTPEESREIAPEAQEIVDENGIHSELMANLEKLKLQREKLDSEEANDEDTDSEEPGDLTSAETETPDEKLPGKDKLFDENSDLVFDPPVVELTEASLLSADLENHTENDEEAAASDTSEQQKKQIEIIDSFIKNSPVLSKPNLSADSEATSQTDLSVKSAKFHQDFVSENLASILAKQGKRKDAVGIYKKLMVKFPEKKAYFADQIESLNTK